MQDTKLGDGKTRRVPIPWGVHGLVNESDHFCLGLVRLLSYRYLSAPFHLPGNDLVYWYTDCYSVLSSFEGILAVQ